MLIYQNESGSLKRFDWYILFLFDTEKIVEKNRRFIVARIQEHMEVDEGTVDFVNLCLCACQ